MSVVTEARRREEVCCCCQCNSNTCYKATNRNVKKCLWIAPTFPSKSYTSSCKQRVYYTIILLLLLSLFFYSESMPFSFCFWSNFFFFYYYYYVFFGECEEKAVILAGTKLRVMTSSVVGCVNVSLSLSFVCF